MPAAIGITVYQLVLSPAIVAANTTAEQLFNLPGGINVPTGAAVVVTKPTAQAGIGICGARLVQGNPNQVGITFNNNTAGGITPTVAETYQVAVIQS